MGASPTKYREITSSMNDTENNGETMTLETELDADTGSFGIMFDIMAFKELFIVGMSFYTDVTSEINYELYMKDGAYFSAKSNKDDWTLKVNGVTKGLGRGKTTRVSGFKAVGVDVNKVVGVYMTFDSYDMRHSTTKLKLGDANDANEDLMIGVGSSVEDYPLGIRFTQPRLFRGAVHYINPPEASVITTISPTPIPTMNPTPMPTLPPTPLKSAPSPSPSSASYKDLKIVEACTKQLLYLQGEDIGIITADNIILLQKIIKFDLNKIFSKSLERVQILDVIIVDQMFDPTLPRDTTIVSLILGSFPNIKNFAFDAEVQKVFDSASENMILQLKSSIDKYSKVTDMLSVIDWNLNSTEARCGKDAVDELQEKEMIQTGGDSNEKEPASGLTIGAMILTCIAGFFVCFCMPAFLLQYLLDKQKGEGNAEYNDDTITRLAELYAKSAYSAWTDDAQGQ